MKHVRITLILCLAIGLGLQVSAQIETPAPSPFCKIEQMVGLTKVTLEYSRPGVKDREIFGGLVPYDNPWRTGANAVTKVGFNTDVMFGEVKLEKGDYALITTPGKEMWTFHFFPYESSSWSSYLEDGAEGTKVMVEPVTIENVHVESMTLMIDELRNGSATFYLIWDDVYVGTEFTVPTDEMVMSSIEEVMSGPSARDYYAAASYYHSEDKDLAQALDWMNKAIEMGEERYWMLRQKSLIQAKLGMKSEAIATAKRSLELAEEAGSEEYIRMNKESIAEWSGKGSMNE